MRNRGRIKIGRSEGKTQIVEGDPPAAGNQIIGRFAQKRSKNRSPGSGQETVEAVKYYH